MALYHANVFMPKRIRNMVPQHTVHLTYSKHALREMHTDRYGKLPMLSSVCIGHSAIVEVEEYSGKLAKVVFRSNIDEQLDMCIAAIPECKGRMFVKTVWANEVNDNHRTLDVRRYEQKS